MALVAAKLLAAPLPTERSLWSKPVTASLNVTVIGNAPDTGSVDPDVTETVGTVPSKVRENCVATTLSLPAPSCATLAATSSVTAPSDVGVMSTV